MRNWRLCLRLFLFLRPFKNIRRAKGIDLLENVLLHFFVFFLLLFPTEAVSHHQTAVDTLLAFKAAVKNSSRLRSWEKGDPCLSRWLGVECTENFTITALKLSNLKLSGTLSPLLGNLKTLTSLWLDSNAFIGPIPHQLGELTNLTSLRLCNNLLNGSIPESLGRLPKLKELYLYNNDLSGTLPFDQSAAQVMHIVVDGNNQMCTLVPGFGLPVCGPTLAPSLIFGPVAVFPRNKNNDRNHAAAIAGGAAGAVVLVVISMIVVSCCLFQAKRFPSATSDTGSSDPSVQLDWVKGPEVLLVGGTGASLPDNKIAKQFTLEELEHATKKFSNNNLIGEGGFGTVYKGLLDDGTIVALKRRTRPASEDFAPKVDALSRIHHRHLVNVLGFCQENDQQMVIYDYLPNGSVSSHLYDVDGHALGELDFKQRLSIALGAAKGLEHLHKMSPAVIHKDFKTNNVLLDANLVSSVTDFGLSSFLSESQVLQEGLLVSTSSADGTAGFLDPEYYRLQQFTAKSDVYSFGVFLLELISGREAISLNRPRPQWSLVEWGRTLLQEGSLGTLVDDTLESTFMEVAMRKVMEVAFKCVELTGERRPTMSDVVVDLEDALEKERGFVAGGGDGTTTVTLGSELFT